MRSAVDTNVLLRFLVDDGSGHVAATRRVFAMERVFVPLSVMLESEWVLRSSFGFTRLQICDAFDRLLGLETVTVQEVDIVEAAVTSARKGMDFADALHWHASADCENFYTIDMKFARKAKGMEPGPKVRQP